MIEQTENTRRTAGERRAAHERLSTGGLARWMRACATHPWRVVFSWVGIIAALIVIVIAFGGGLKDEFEIPGSETQKATDLIEAEFASEQGGVLNLVFAAPEGERLDTPERKAAIEAGRRESEDRASSRRPTTWPGSTASATRSTPPPSRTTDASPMPRRSSTA